MIRIFFGCIIFMFSINLKSQSFLFLDSINIPVNSSSLFLRTCYYDYFEEDRGSTRKDFENGIDLRQHYYTNDLSVFDSINNLWLSDSSSFSCFCGYDFEILLYSGDRLIKKMKYVFCCDGFVIDRNYLFINRDKMTRSIKLMTPVENKYLLEYLKEEWIEY